MKNSKVKIVLFLTKMDVEGAPVGRAGLKVVAFDVEVPRADSLTSEPVEQRHP